MGGTTSTNTTQQIPQNIVDTGKSLFQTAQNYEAGTGGQYPQFHPNVNLASGLAQTAGFTPDQQSAFAINQGTVGSQAPAMSAAFTEAGAASQPIGYGQNGQFLGTIDKQTANANANPYAFSNLGSNPDGSFAGNIGASQIQAASNPYTQQVVNAGLTDMNRQYQQDQNSNTANAINGGAAWGSRSADMAGQLARNYDLASGEYSANQNAAGYNAGKDLAQQNYGNLYGAQSANTANAMQGYNTGLSAAQQNWQNYYGTAAGNQSAAANLATLYPQLAQQGISMDQSQAQNLYTQGAAQQALNQQAINSGWQNQQAAQQYPIDQLNALSSFNVMQPYSKVTNTTQTSQPGLGQIIGAGIGGAASLFGSGGIFSDERMKDNIAEPDMTPKQALAAFVAIPVKDWNYTKEAQDKYGLPDTRVTGPMAQDYDKHLGTATTHPDGHMMVNVADTLGKITLAIKELARRTAPPKKEPA